MYAIRSYYEQLPCLENSYKRYFPPVERMRQLQILKALTPDVITSYSIHYTKLYDRFLTRMGIVKYESHSGYISHIINEEDLSNVYTKTAGIFHNYVNAGVITSYSIHYTKLYEEATRYPINTEFSVQVVSGSFFHHCFISISLKSSLAFGEK